MVSGVHLQGNGKKEVQVQGVEQKPKYQHASPLPGKAPWFDESYKRPTILFIVCFAKLMHNFWDYANCETL